MNYELRTEEFADFVVSLRLTRRAIIDIEKTIIKKKAMKKVLLAAFIMAALPSMAQVKYAVSGTYAENG